MNTNFQVVVIVDDSESDRYFFSRVMQKINPHLDLHEFAYAEDALSFLRSPSRPQADLLLVDINMPRMNGFEFADEYQKLYSELRGTAPVFIASSSLNPADQEKAEMQPGVAGYVEKPFNRQSMEALFAQINKMAFGTAAE